MLHIFSTIHRHTQIRCLFPYSNIFLIGLYCEQNLVCHYGIICLDVSLHNVILPRLIFLMDSVGGRWAVVVSEGTILLFNGK